MCPERQLKVLSQILYSALFIYSLLTASSAYCDETPSWRDRTSFGFNFEEGLKPSYFLETVCPIYQDKTKTDTLFLQPRANYDPEDHDYYNLGLGYRHYWEAQNVLVGVNTFGDFERENRHGRLGLGFEVLGSLLDARFNGYLGVTPRRVEDEALGLYEKVLNGFDFEVGGVIIPQWENIKIFAGGDYYDYKTREDSIGWHARAEWRALPYLVLEIKTGDDYRREVTWTFEMRVSLDIDPCRSPKNESKKTDARDRSLERVVRQNKILKERLGEGGLIFSVAKA